MGRRQGPRHPNRLKELRAEVGKSLSQVSRDLDIHFTTLCRHERGDRKLPGERVRQYARYYRVRPVDIYFVAS